jgi:hypothetical protein
MHSLNHDMAVVIGSWQDGQVQRAPCCFEPQMALQA